MEWFWFDTKLNFFKVFLSIVALIFLTTWLLRLLTNSLETSLQNKELIASTQSIETETSETEIFIPCLYPYTSWFLNTWNITNQFSFSYSNPNISPMTTTMTPNIMFAKKSNTQDALWECRYRDSITNQWMIVTMSLPYNTCQVINPWNEMKYTMWFLCPLPQNNEQNE